MAESNGKAKIVFLLLAVISFISAVLTLLPYKNIDDECFLGYKALCAITPVSTLILIVAGIVFLYLRKKA
jgi:uncharacterized membrane protein YozB (DUF420 family)